MCFVVGKRVYGEFTKQCIQCGKEFKVPHYRLETAKTCSRECQNKYQNQKNEVACIMCGTMVLRKPSQIRGNVFCSNKCVGNWNSINNDQKVEKTCTICCEKYKVKRNEVEKSVACSRECHAIWQSIYRRQENSPRWKENVNRNKICEMCGTEFKIRPYELGKAKFCSHACLGKYLSTINHTPEANAKRALTMKKPEIREGSRKRALKTLSNYPQKTKPETMAEKFLKDKKINYNSQVVINNKFCVDIIIHEYNVVIEIQGDYFHSNPEKFPSNKLNKQQRIQIKKDKARFNYLTKCGYIVFGIWENDILNNVEDAFDQVLTYIKTGEKSKITGFRFLYDKLKSEA